MENDTTTLITLERKRHNLTQRELAALLGVSAAAVSNLENHHIRSWPKIRHDMAELFEVNESDLFGADEGPLLVSDGVSDRFFKDRRLRRHGWPTMSDDSYSQGRIVLKPGRMSGQATIGESRLPVGPVVETYLALGFDETVKMWPQLTETDIKLACWFWWQYDEYSGVPSEWAVTHRDALRAGDWDAVPLPPGGPR